MEEKIFTTSLGDCPNEIKHQIVSYLDYEDILCFLQTNKDNARIVLLFLDNKKAKFFICGSEIFWSPTPNELYEYVLNGNAKKFYSRKCRDYYSFRPVRSREHMGEIKKIYLGDNHDYKNDIFLLTNNGIYARGRNGYGQLGLGHKKFCSSFTKIYFGENIGQLKSIFPGPKSTLILTDKGLYASGKRGNLGLGESKDCRPYDLITNFTRVSFRNNITILEAGLSDNHCLILTNQGPFACGQNNSCQLGFMSYEYNFWVNYIFIHNDISDFTEVPFESKYGRIKKIIAKSSHTFLITDKNLLFAAGHGISLGLGDQLDSLSTFMRVQLREDITQIKQIIAFDDKTLLLTDKGLFVCGKDQYGELGLGKIGSFSIFTQVPLKEEIGKIRLITSSGKHSLLLTDKALYACGLNDYGQLGLGDEQNRKIFTPVPLQIEIGEIKTILVGEEYTTLLTVSGLYACGRTEISSHKKKLRTSFSQVAIFPTEVSNYLKYGYQMELDINKVVSILDKDEKDAIIAKVNSILDKYFKHELPGQRKKLFGGNPKHTAEVLRLQSEVKYIHATSISITDLNDRLRDALEPFMVQNPLGGERLSTALHEIYSPHTTKFTVVPRLDRGI